MDVPMMALDRAQVLDVLRVSPQASHERLWRAAECGGIRVLDLTQVFRECPLFPTGWPRLAVARANWSRVNCSVEDTAIEFAGARIPDNGRIRWSEEHGGWVWGYGDPAVDAERFLLPCPAARAICEGGQYHATVIKETSVPVMPAALAAQFPPERHHLLFEVEMWERGMTADPIILSHLVGSLYEVNGEWNPTTLERAALALVQR